MARMRIPLALLAGALLAASCGDSSGDGPQFVEVPLDCGGVIDRLEQRAGGWPDPADPQDLVAVNNDLFAAVNALPEGCDDAVFQRLDEIECDYLTTVSAADEATATILAAQRVRCEDDPVPEADPDDPAATVEDQPTGVPPTDRCDEARAALEVEGFIPDRSNLPPGCAA